MLWWRKTCLGSGCVWLSLLDSSGKYKPAYYHVAYSITTITSHALAERDSGLGYFSWHRVWRGCECDLDWPNN
ncbi:hypothetical protein F5144DRAFT_564031 [Chaetomium tenue]|uniref:Uncharacterized protein n=1 Tax=Chaetomium tenue TaxID=1854479 RepID=A0ACB7PJ03_9PEZI|nr:hypothetical protein F5144DRAFT_564031 [Chaetomium globosum]